MKKVLLLLAMIAFSFSRAGAQVVPVISTTLTPGSGDFLVDKSHYPFDAFVLYILSTDTGRVGLNYTMTGGAFITTKPRVKYIDGRTGQPFVSIARLQQFYDSFMVSPPFTTTIAGDLNILGDATAANQVSEKTDLDSLLKWQTNLGVTVQTLSALGTYSVPAGSILIGGIKTSSGAPLAFADITGASNIEFGFIANGAAMCSLPKQSYKALSVAHTITAVSGCSLFILKLN